MDLYAGLHRAVVSPKEMKRKGEKQARKENRMF